MAERGRARGGRGDYDGGARGGGGGSRGGRGGQNRGSGGGNRGGYDYGRGGGGGSRGGYHGGATDDAGRGMQNLNIHNRGHGEAGGRGRGDFGGRGRGGGGGRGRSTTTVRFEVRAGPESLDQKQKLGWKKDFISKDQDPEGVNKLPDRKNDSGVKAFIKEIGIRLNHFPVRIRFPKQIHQYRVDLTRIRNNSGPDRNKPKPNNSKRGGRAGGGGRGGGGGGDPTQVRMLPADLRKRILLFIVPRLQKDLGNEYGIISDFSAAIYSVKVLEESDQPLEYILHGSTIPKNLELFKDVEDCELKISISKTTEVVDTSNLAVDVNNMRGKAVTEELVSLERIYSVLMRCVRLNLYTPVRRADLVDYTARPHPLGGGVVSFPGFSAQMPITNGWKKFINIEIANLATYLSGPVYHLIQDVLESKRSRANVRDFTTWNNWDLEDVNNIIKTCKVSYRSQPNKTFTKKVVKVCRDSVSQITFDYNGRIISVYTYFTQILHVQLQDPNGACLDCNGPKIPAEICNVRSGQSFNRKLNENQVTEIAKVARLDPSRLQKSISDAMEKLGLRNNVLLQTYGMDIENQGRMHEVRARVLTPPELCYGPMTGSSDRSKRAVIIPEDGVWDIWDQNFEFYTVSNVHSWGILNLAENIPRDYVDQRSALNFAQQMSIKAATRGVQIPKPVLYLNLPLDLKDPPDDWDKNVSKLGAALEKMKQALAMTDKVKSSFVLVILPKKGGQLYNHVKQAAEMHVGVLTQCIIGKNMTNPSRFNSVLGNILLKINSKLSKVNHTVMAPPNFRDCFSLLNYPTMIIGADVTHPPPGSAQIIKNPDGTEYQWGPPSFAAVTANIDRTGMPYMMHVQAQQKAGKGAAEVIEKLDEIIVKFMKRYYKETKKKPYKIIYFRDGVGDGQFQEVLRTEMAAIRKACTFLEAGYEPRITFITVQKRHKTRFFLPDSSENAPPGTVVDTDIVHPVENDFYLLSHKGLLGTSRPTRYHILWDDSDFSMNEIQIISYFLCYMFVRCNRSVKIPAPTYYAHWAAKRAEILSKGWCENYYRDRDIPGMNQVLSLREKNGFADVYPMHFV